MVRFSTRIAEFSSQPAATAEEIRIGSKTQPAREPANPPAPSCHIWLAGWPAWQPPLSPHITGEQLVPKNSEFSLNYLSEVSIFRVGFHSVTQQ